MTKDCYAHGDSLVRQIKTYVISLRESTRNPALFEQLETQGFAPSVIRAVDGRAGLGALDPNQMDLGAYRSFVGRPASGAEIACALSHAKVATLAKEEGANLAFVLEDDAFITHKLLPLIEIFVSGSSRGAAVFTFFSTDPPDFVGPVTTKEGTAGEIFELGKLLVPPPTTVGYLLNKAAIEFFAQERLIESTADWPPWSFKADFWGSYPWPIRPVESSQSDIQPQRGTIIPAQFQSSSLPMVFRRVPHFFSLRRIMIHSRALGGPKHYLKRVIAPYLIIHWRSLVARLSNWHSRS